MPARAQTVAIRAGASDSEDDLATAATNGASRKPVTKKMPTSRATATKTSTATKRKAAPKQSRQALKDRTNIQSDAEDDAPEEDDAPKRKLKRARKAAASRKPKAAKTAEPVVVVQETQPDPEDVEQSVEMEEVEVDAMDIAQVPTPVQVPQFVQRPRSASVQPLQQLQPRPSARSVSAIPGYPAPRDRSASASGTERERRGGDPELRRKLNDITKKFDSLNLKYQNLQELGKTSADTNFEKLKRASDDKAKDAAQVIASLKKEIAELRKPSNLKDAAEVAGLQKEVASLTATNAKVTAENTALKATVQTAQNASKSLEAKLVAARQQISASQDTKAPVSTATSRSVAGTVPEAQKTWKMKENLYSDLTGLLIQNVRQKDNEDQFDCIQTGKNGTLHFRITVDNEAASNPKTPTGQSYEDDDYVYEPLFEKSRDRELLDLLPEFLLDDITFPRRQAMAFFGQVLDKMNTPVVLEDDSE